MAMKPTPQALHHAIAAAAATTLAALSLTGSHCSTQDEVPHQETKEGSESQKSTLHCRLLAGRASTCMCDAAFQSAPPHSSSFSINIGNRRSLASNENPSSVETCSQKVEATAGSGKSVPLKRRRTVHMLNSAAERTSVAAKYDVDPEPVGEGGYGEVFIATNRRTHERVALKKIYKDRTDRVEIQREVDALLHLRQNGGHPNICMLRENFDEDDNYALVLDLVRGGELFDHLIENGPYSEADAARLVREVASALDFCHAIGVVHADLKPENLMLSSRKGSNAAIKIVDFGCSEILRDGQLSSPINAKTSGIKLKSGNPRRLSPGGAGGSTPAYCPPEAFAENEGVPLNPSVDMWSLGIIIYMMLTGVHPFDLEGKATDEEVKENIRAIKSPPLHGSPFTAHLSPSAIDLLSRLLNLDPDRRLSAQEMLQHPWVLGETASQDVMQGSDKRLAKFRRFQTKIEAKVFNDLVAWSDDDGRRDIGQRDKSLIERVFGKLDKSGRGSLRLEDLDESDATSALQPGNALDSEYDSSLSLSGFSDLLKENMKQRFFPRGHTVFREGDEGDRMYFINSGTVNVSTSNGFAAQLGHGDTFGIGSLLEEHKCRSATIKCATPVHVIEIDKECFKRYLSGSDSELAVRLREKVLAHRFGRAVHLIEKQQCLKDVHLEQGDVVFNHGEDSDAVYVIGNGRLDLFAKGGNKMFSLKAGDLVGFPSFIVEKPRGSLALCATKGGCDLKRMEAGDFRELLKTSVELRESLREVGLRREFQRAVVLKTKMSFPTASEMRKVFDAIDPEHRGELNAKELTEIISHLDPTLTEHEIKELIASMKLSKTGALSLDEFNIIFGSK